MAVGKEERGAMIYYFFYEKNSLGKWSPVLYHGEKPKIKDGYTTSVNGQQKQATVPVEIREEFEPSFGFLMKQFPPPQEQIMVRPIEGYKTKDGKFFENEKDATIHEVVYELTGALREFLKETVFEETPPEAQDEFVLRGLQFVSENAETVRRYLDAIGGPEEVPPPSPIGDEDNRSATEGAS